jgi:hypothetical protein
VNIPPTNCATAPLNDAFSNATVIATSPSTTSEFNNCATKQSGEPNHAGNTGGHSVWFAWTPTSNHTATITTRRSSFDTELAVYAGDAVNALSLVASNDDISVSNSQSRVTFNAIAGTLYRIAVDGFGSAVGTVILNIDPPANDDFTNRFLLSGPASSTNGWNLGASKETSETAHASDVGGSSVWYQWLAPRSGFVDFNTAGSTYDTTLAIYTNSTMTSSNLPVAANDDDAEGGGLQTSRTWFYALAGTNYYIAVDGFGGDAGDLKLNWNMNSLLTITNQPNGDVQLALTGVDWQRYVLLGSTDLVEWYTNTAAITMADGRHFYTNTPSDTNGTFGRQFYRAILVP